MNNLQMHPGGQGGEVEEEREIGAMEALWSFFSSMKTAIWLLLALALASVAGTVIEDKMGVSIYGTPWYTVLLILVGVNLAVCSVNRFGLVWQRFAHPVVAVHPKIVASMPTSAEASAPGPAQAAVDSLVRVLKSRRYDVATEAAGDSTAVYGVRGRSAMWGPHVTHVSLLVIFAGAVYGHMLGAEGYTTILENDRTAGYYKAGQKQGQEVKTPLGFEVALKSFVIKHDAKHNPIGYKSDLQVYDGGKLVDSKVVDVNHPLTYKGLSFYQSDYGLSELLVKITSPAGQVMRIPYHIHTKDGPQGRIYSVEDNTVTQFTLGGKKMTILVHNLIPDYLPDYSGTDVPNGSMLPLNPAVEVMLNDRYPAYKGMDAWARMGWMTASQSAKFKGYTVEIEKIVNYTGLQVSRNPGLPVVYLGFAMMILGVILSLYVSHKIVRVVVSPAGQDARVVIGTSAVELPGSPDKDLQSLREALGAGR